MGIKTMPRDDKKIVNYTRTGVVIIAVGSNEDEVDSDSTYPICRQLILDLQYYITGGRLGGRGGRFDGYEMSLNALSAEELDPTNQPALLRWAIAQLQQQLVTAEQQQTERQKANADAAR
jgi:hypothetical protein